MTPDSALEPAVLFKNDSARPIDRVIDFFGDGAIRQGDDTIDARALAGLSRLEAPVRLR